jgi:hypothetical protein
MRAETRQGHQLFILCFGRQGHHALKGHMSCSSKRLPMFPDKFLKAHWLVTCDVLDHAIRAGENACRVILRDFKEMLCQEG